MGIDAKYVSYYYASTMIKNYRESLGLSQSEFADKLGVSQSRVSHCETGRRPVTKNFADRLILFSASTERPLTYNDIFGSTSGVA